VEFDCSRDPAESALVHPTAGLSYGQFEVYCTSDNSSAGQCRVTDDCKRDSDGDGISDTDDTDDDNDGTLDLYDDDDGDRIPDDHDNNFLVDEDPNKPNPEPYTIPFLASVVQRFAERLSLFFERMKQTSLFSLPNQLTGSAHFSGGHSTFVIEGGEVYGRQEIDFTVWSGGLVVFRVVIYISAIFTSVRIVTLKR
jgi:hypothetical protein